MQVSVIPANKQMVNKIMKKKKLKVAAYARVSTEQEEQESSYETQVRSYTEKITNNKEWEFAGIYADEGISGTGTKKRKDFLRMIDDCQKGKIDMILTKSISRFARNTVDCLQYVRMLKGKGITVIFEKEGINTSELSNEMLLTIMGSFAQAESESISQNVTWGMRKRFKEGKVAMHYKNFLGYREGKDKKPEIVPEEAEIVRVIYDSFLAGSSIIGIKKKLEELKALSPAGKTQWSTSTIRSILQNEKYIGDAILQKTYTVDFLTKTKRKNNGELAKYYVSDHHPAIIKKEIFYRVQEELARRSNKEKNGTKEESINRGRYSSQYALTDLLFCGTCGTKYRRTTWSKNGNKKIVWRCINRLENGKKYCKDSPTVEENTLHTAIMKGISKLIKSKEEVKNNLKEGLLLAIRDEKSEMSEESIKLRITELNNEIKKLLREITDSTNESNDFKFKEITDEVRNLQLKLQEKNKGKSINEGQKSRTEEIIKIVEDTELELKSFDEDLVRKIVEDIKIVNKEVIIIKFYGGIQVEEILI